MGGVRAMGRRRAGGGGGGHREGGEKRGLQAILADELAGEVEALIGREAVAALDFERLEVTVRRRALELAARAVEQRLNADLSDYLGPTTPCPCGEPARYAGRRPKHFETALGRMRLERAYYDCSRCQSGFCPRDRTLGLAGRSTSPAVTRMVGTVGALVSFQEGSDLLAELAGVPVGAKQVERIAEELGRRIAEHEQQAIEPEPAASRPSTLYLADRAAPARKPAPTIATGIPSSHKTDVHPFDRTRIHFDGCGTGPRRGPREAPPPPPPARPGVRPRPPAAPPPRRGSPRPPRAPLRCIRRTGPGAEPSGRCWNSPRFPARPGRERTGGRLGNSRADRGCELSATRRRGYPDLLSGVRHLHPQGLFLPEIHHASAPRHSISPLAGVLASQVVDLRCSSHPGHDVIPPRARARARTRARFSEASARLDPPSPAGTGGRAATRRRPRGPPRGARR